MANCTPNSAWHACVQAPNCLPIPLAAALWPTCDHLLAFLLRQGSGFYLGGVLLVVYGWTFVGFIVEAVGFWFLFCDFIPTVLSYSKQLPLVNRLFDIPAVKMVRCHVQMQ